MNIDLQTKLYCLLGSHSEFRTPNSALRMAMDLPEGFPAEVVERAKRVEALVLDVDGVLTDGRVIYDEFGDELKCFDIQDGTGLVLWHRVGLASAIITGRKTKLVQRRAKDLHVGFVAQKALNKLPVYEKLIRKRRLSHEQVCAIGDDLIDLPLLRRVGFAVAVSNAVDEVKQASHYVTTRPGGRGAVREVIDIILKCKELWNNAVEIYYV